MPTKSVPVLEVRVSVLDRHPSLTAVCPGFEAGRWRAAELARDIVDRHLLSFALPYSEWNDKALNHTNAAQNLRRAARTIYATEKYSKRGEFGELILHAIAMDVFGSQPAISKIYFKDSPNDTVKGFDAVHVVEVGDDLELWLGEVKFYDDLARAIRDVTDELRQHLMTDYLRSEFTAITNKLDDEWPHSSRVARILHENTSLDQIFDALTIPVLLTYNSEAVRENSRICEEYVAAIREEAEAALKSFEAKCDASWTVRLRLILLPMHDKATLVSLFHEELKVWQRR